MDFRELAIGEHHKAEQEMAELKVKRAKRFAGAATKAFSRSIADRSFSVTPIDPYLALIVIDGIEIEAREEHNAPEFYFAAECPECKEKSYVRTPTLADIGKALENGPKRCKHCEAKRAATVMPGGWPEQIADAIREAVYEAQS